MSRLFVDTSSEYAEYAGTLFPGYPLTIACWFYSDDATVNQDLVSIVDSAATAGLSCLRLAARGGVGGDPVQAIANDATGPAGVATTSTGYSANTWHHACGVFAGATSRAAYIDGGSKGTDTTNRSPPGTNRTTIGALRQATSVVFMSGRIAEVAIWAAALSDAEVAALARGISPLGMRPTNLIAYWPLWGIHSTEIDIHPRSASSVAHELTLSGTTRANHSPGEPFSRRFWLPNSVLEVTPAPTGSSWYYNLQQQLACDRREDVIQ